MRISPQLAALVTAAGLAVLGTVAAVPAAAAVTTTTTLGAPVPAAPQAGVALTLKATVSPAPDGGTVAFSDSRGSIYQCTAVTVTSGTASCTTAYSGTGSVSFTAAYSGDTGYAASSGSRTITVAARTFNPAAGNIATCSPTVGAAVAVDYGPWSGPIALGCDPSPTTGIKLLTNGGFTTAGDQHDGPAFICRIGTSLFTSGTQYPTPAQDPCVVTPPAAAYWSYWLAPAGQNTWTYSPLGAYSDQPKVGEVEAWVYGGTDSGGTYGQPTFTPNAVRGLETQPKPKTATRAAGVRTPAKAQAALGSATPAGSGVGASADLTKAVQYLVSTTGANGVTGGTSLSHDGYYESFDQFADFGLTIDGAFALVATGGDNAVLSKVVDFLDQLGKDGSSRTVNDWTGIGTAYASGGSIGKEALLAEVTGYNPHHFGGQDLIAALDATVCTTTSSACAGAGNYSYATSTFSQALGIMAQLRAGDSADAGPPITFLEGLQNASGAFPSLIPNSGDSDVDSTAMAAMALALLPNDATASAAVTKAVGWIAGQQESDGGFPGAAGDSTNSAALAIQGLSLAGSTYTAQIAKAQAFLAGEQNSDGGFNVASSGQVGSDVRASTQVVGGIVGTSFGTLSDIVAPPGDPAAAAKYLVGQLVDGTHLEFSGGFGPNYGGTADLAFALAAAGTQDKALVQVVKYLSQHVADYADPDGKAASYPGPYTGAAAKLALLAEVTGQKPTAFGGYNLLSTLTKNVCAAADSSGACTAAGDFYQAFSTVSQALGVLALARAGVTPPAATVTRLEQLQCSDGGFSSLLITSGQACTSDVDTTGYALQALALVPGSGASIDRAVRFLLGGQQADGGWVGASGENSDSTALAIQGLLAAPAVPAATLRAAAAPAAGSSAAVRAAQHWLAARQNGNGGFGISGASPASDPEATAQSVPAIVNAPFTTLSHPIRLGGSASGTSGGGTSGGGSSSGSSGGSGGGGGGLADTGADPLPWIELALLLLVAGAAALAAGSGRFGGRAVTVAGRHRSGAR